MTPLANIRHQGFTGISEGMAIYRYLGIDAALNTLINRKIRFTQLRALDDPWEGTLGAATIESYRATNESIWAEHGYQIHFSNERYALHQNLNRVFNYVSSWTLNDPENMVMWKSFSQSPSSCCLVSTVSSIRDSFSRDIPMISVGAVDYSHHEEIPVSSFNLQEEIWRKRKAYEYEREVRFIIDKVNDGPDGQKLLIDEDEYTYEDFDPASIFQLVLHPQAPIGTENYLASLLGPIFPALNVRYPTISNRPPITSL